MEKELADELHKPVKRKFPQRREISNGINQILSADLVEMQKFSKRNKRYRYLLMVLDISAFCTGCIFAYFTH